MPQILQLEAHIADLIAAGEVVERPASVVKELVENAIDAGATKVTVEIQNGGMSLIRVTDDGCGIAAEDAETAFLRHATSKIKNQYDLEAIGTLGFRGEALAAIAAVARVELLTRPPEAALGTSLSVTGGVVQGREEAGCPAGTTMVVRDLFFNTPARLKFMKKDAAEGASVFAAVQRLALSHPEVGITFLRDGKREMQTPGSGILRDAVYSVLGRDLALGLIEVDAEFDGDMHVSGFVSVPTCCRGTRGYQHFFVNGRYVKNPTMTAAVEEAYSNQKMVGKFPACVIHLGVRPNSVDVNVHPAKTEVKFGADRDVFRAVYGAVKQALEGDNTRPTVVLTDVKPPVQDSVTPNQMPVSIYRRTEPVPQELPLYDVTARTEVPAPPPVPVRHEAAPTHVEEEKPVPPQEEIRETARQAESPPTPPEPEELPPWRLVGEVLHTYIIVEQGETILLIDKHAAHERMHFDRMQAQDYTPMMQGLLSPIVLTLPAEAGAALLQNGALLERFGFELEEFGGGSVLVRGAPADLDLADVEDTLAGIAAAILETGTARPDAPRDVLLHTMACKAAIKAGQKNAPEELRRVAEAVLSGRVRYCPHGRPVAIALTKGQLERQFKRT
ncbi:MAG: DNA mismatch repair endonuclease MutL [Oscillospiraceae bacterium]|nr:DNA mismatch repair endonuclease MutL [Oscillospiraceae bacterium]